MYIQVHCFVACLLCNRIPRFSTCLPVRTLTLTQHAPPILGRTDGRLEPEQEQDDGCMHMCGASSLLLLHPRLENLYKSCRKTLSELENAVRRAQSVRRHGLIRFREDLQVDTGASQSQHHDV